MQNIIDPNCIIKAFENTGVAFLRVEKNYYVRGSDIANILELTNIHMSVQNFSEREKELREVYTQGGPQKVLFLSSRGVYRLLYSSKKKIAEKFRNWIGDILDDIIFNDSKELKMKLQEKEKYLELSRQKELEFVAQLEECNFLIVQKDLELSKNLKKLREAKAENLEQWYYVWKVNDNSTKGGISSDPDSTIKTYLRNSTNPMFYWIHKFENPDKAEMIEQIIKSMLAEFREKCDKRTEVFALDQETFKKFAQTIIQIYDSNEEAPLLRITKFIDAFEKNAHLNDSKIDAILEKLEKIEVAQETPVPTIINNTNTAPTIINNAPSTVNIEQPKVNRKKAIPSKLLLKRLEELGAQFEKITDNPLYKWKCLHRLESGTVCNKMYKKPIELDRHVRSPLHLYVREFNCDQCNGEFADQTALTRHIKTVHDHSLICTCNVCGLELRDTSGLTRHIKEQHQSTNVRWRCPLETCDKFSSPYKHDNTLVAHIKQKHPEINVANLNMNELRSEIH